jgi:putative ABC transport system permease protein
MFRHLMKLTWKRKTRHLMLSLELLLAFAIVFAIAAFAVRSIELYRLPLGFAYDDVLAVTMRTASPHGLKADQQVYDNFKRGLRELPEIEKVAFATFAPFTHSTMSNDAKSAASGKAAWTSILEASDDFASVMGVQLVQGRWFSSEDDGATATPVVLNRALASILFPHETALGGQFYLGTDRDHKNPLKVVGIVNDYRGKGDLMTPTSFMFRRFIAQDSEVGVRAILLKVKPGTGRSLEARLNRQLKLVRNDWSYEISPLKLMRKSVLKEDTIPLLVLSVIAAFMLTMVTFGLFGVLWQNTTQRIPEIGLRRALGATSTSIYRQIVTEQLLLSSGAMLVGLVLLVQLPLTGAFGVNLNWKVFISATALSAFVIYLISLVCSLYPGWRASRLAPTEALHYE